MAGALGVKKSNFLNKGYRIKPSVFSLKAQEKDLQTPQNSGPLGDRGRRSKNNFSLICSRFF